MLPNYEDIKSRLGEPIWYDTNGVPRYDAFTPEMCGVYDKIIGFMKIKCQRCDKEFFVTVQYTMMDKAVYMGEIVWPSLIETDKWAQVGSFHYGDPPDHDDETGHTCVGCSMNSVPVQVVQMWTRDADEFSIDWRRRPEYEITFSEDEHVTG